ncbi:hypothetical protein C3941_07605 [Kaistia algarum]|uniref:hypothetical protein n=1 Tax=Kaistia algarum TaxID=2083279 RepID=UPI000CE768D3|nr:hypothetical protein [Kaistia algarum]MCX5511923.1 hypothetical protein [Kaistia algarum]PPE80056.1 hypothetical protein C3941_07605 [Kaistia algarum]
MIRALIAMLMLALLGGVAAAGSRDLDDPTVGVGRLSRGSVPLCDQNSVLGNVASRYRSVQADLWQTGLAIASVGRINETAFEPGELLDRRFCHAKVELSNGRPADVFYLIEERQGFASIGWGVEFCVPGQDPWRVYDGGCRTLRP